MIIKQKNLTENENRNLALRSSSFFLGYKKYNTFKSQHKVLTDLLGTKYTNEAWLFITLLVKTLRQKNTHCKFTKNKNNYTKVRSMGLNISYTKCMKVLEILEKEKYIDIYEGFYTTKQRLMTIISFKHKFTSMFDKPTIDKVVKPFEYKELVEVRDSKKKQIDANFLGIKTIRDEVNGYNELLDKTDINLMGKEWCVYYKRVFVDNLYSAGRWYGGGFQCFESDLREHILLDGELTVELDVSNIHPAILACKKGFIIPPTHKVYEAYNTTLPNSSELRSLYKQALICMIYSGSREESSSSIGKHYAENCKSKYKYTRLKKGDISTIQDNIIKHNPFLEEYFYNKSLWKELQYIDSEICRNVINTFVSLKVPILSYHDSFIVPLSYKDKLVEVMEQAWFEVLGTNDNLVIK